LSAFLRFRYTATICFTSPASS